MEANFTEIGSGKYARNPLSLVDNRSVEAKFRRVEGKLRRADKTSEERNALTEIGSGKYARNPLSLVDNRSVEAKFRRVEGKLRKAEKTSEGRNALPKMPSENPVLHNLMWRVIVILGLCFFLRFFFFVLSFIIHLISQNTLQRCTCTMYMVCKL